MVLNQTFKWTVSTIGKLALLNDVDSIKGIQDVHDMGAENMGYGWNLLHLAAASGSCETARFLIEENHCLVGGKTLSGLTPLHLAVYFGHLQMTVILLEAGADVFCGNPSPFDLSLTAQRTTIRKTICQWFKDHNIIPINNQIENKNVFHEELADFAVLEIGTSDEGTRRVPTRCKRRATKRIPTPGHPTGNKLSKLPRKLPRLDPGTSPDQTLKELPKKMSAPVSGSDINEEQSQTKPKGMKKVGETKRAPRTKKDLADARAAEERDGNRQNN